MDFSIASGAPETLHSPCVVVGIFANRQFSPAAKQLDRASKGHLTKILKRGDLEGRLGQTLLLYNVPGVQAERVLLIGCGQESELNDNKFREISQKAVTRMNEINAVEAINFLTELSVPGRDVYWKVRQALEVACDTLYRFDRMKTNNKNDRPEHPLKKLGFAVAEQDTPTTETAIREGLPVAKGVKLAKDLANLPSNHCTPSYLADQAREIEKEYTSVKVRVLNENEIKKLGMGSFLAVARGSHEPPRLITLEYKGAKQEKPVVLVGKGITFDTGGISLKPAASMDEMKYDMCGAASVLGVMTAVAEAKLLLHVVGIIPATENMPGGNAVKPGDIVTSMSGQTIEILNTDAEGRLILCDALTYADRYKPDVVIDIATLTGACVVALGQHASGLLSNHDPLAADLLAAGQKSGDRAWHLPLWDEYQKQLDSPFADMANVGGKEAGTITAACFISRYTKKYRWAHLDIAGTAWRGGNKKGATGRPVPLLMQYLLDRLTAK